MAFLSQKPVGKALLKQPLPQSQLVTHFAHRARLKRPQHGGGGHLFERRARRHTRLPALLVTQASERTSQTFRLPLLKPLNAKSLPMEAAMSGKLLWSPLLILDPSRNC
jgi:hypothetical protein